MERELQDKKHQRRENKKRKLTALVNLTESCQKNKLPQEENMEFKKMKFNNDEIVSVEKHNSLWLAPGSEELAALRQRLKLEKEKRHNVPNIRLNEIGQAAELKNSNKNVVPLFLSDVQDLLAFYLTANAFYSPRWCKVDKISRVSQVTLVVVDNVSSYTFSSCESELPSLSASDAIVETLLPAAYGCHLVDEFAHVPISPAYRRRLLDQHGSVDGILQTYKHLRYKMLRAMFPIKCTPSEKGGSVADRFPRTELLLDVQQLIDEKYPLPYGALKEKYSEYVFSKDEYTEVSELSPLFAVDCEMCVTAAGMELTRVSVVDESLTLVYDSLVKPDLPITDYLTRYSGITAKKMKDVTTKLSDVQKVMSDLLPSDAILVGQSLNCDLHALKMMHPYIIDTSVIFNITGSRGRKSKLATLAREFLGEKIQDGSGHCSVEDSSTCIKLVKLKLSNSAEFGDAVLVGRDEAAVHQATAVAAAAGATAATVPTCPQITQPLLQCAVEASRKVAIIGDASAVNSYQSYSVSVTNDLVTYTEVKSGKEGIAKAVEVMDKHCATLVHLPQPANMSELDLWVSTVWHALPPYGILVILLNTQSARTTGICSIRVNKNAKT